MTYEIKVVNLSGFAEHQESELNDLIADAWRLVSVTAAYDADDNATYYRAFLEREVSKKKDPDHRCTDVNCRHENHL